jgi:hypothetical protein
VNEEGSRDCVGEDVMVIGTHCGVTREGTKDISRDQTMMDIPRLKTCLLPRLRTWVLL